MTTCGTLCRFTSSGKWGGTMEVLLGIGIVCLLKRYSTRNTPFSPIVQWMIIHFRSIQIQASILTIWTSFGTLAQLSARLYMMAVSSMHILPDSFINEFWINPSLIMTWLLLMCSFIKAFAGYLLYLFHNAVTSLSSSDCQKIRGEMISSVFYNVQHPTVTCEVGLNKMSEANFDGKRHWLSMKLSTVFCVGAFTWALIITLCKTLRGLCLWAAAAWEQIGRHGLRLDLLRGHG